MQILGKEFKYMEYELSDDMYFANNVAQHALKESEKLELQKVQYEEGAGLTNEHAQASHSHGGRKQHHEKFQAQIRDITGRYGSLEVMRQRLKMSRRQICDYLMVDQSAWSRWVQETSKGAPPHVYRTLALAVEQNLQDSDVRSRVTQSQDLVQGHADHFNSLVKDELAELELKMREQHMSQIENMRERLDASLRQNEKFEILKLGWKIILIINTVLILYVLLR
jgi:hypothetical protein